MQLKVDSEWLPVGWTWKKIEEIGKVQTGSTPKTSENDNFGDYIPFIKPPDFCKDGSLDYKNQGLSKLGLNKARVVDSNSVLMVCIGATIGKVGFTEREVTTNQQINSLTPLKGDYAKFFYYQMLTEDFQQKVLDASGQATLPIINKTKWSNLSLCIPPLAEQKRIVAILDEVFEGCDRAISNTEKNLANARELFESYLNAIFTQKGDEWQEKKLGDVCTFQGGSQPPKAVFSTEKKDGYIRLIQIRDYKSNKYTVYIAKKDARRFCQPDDVMIGRYGPPLFQILRGLEGAYNVALMKAIPKEEIISKDFLFYFLKNRKILNYIINSSSRTAGQTGLNKATIEPYQIAFPVLQEQAVIVSKLQELKAETQKLETIYRQKLAALKELKQSILQKAFTGELTADKEVA